MRAPSMRLTPNRVRLLRSSFAPDASDARVVVAAAPLAPVRCSVHPTDAATVPEHLRQQGVEYVTVKLYEDLAPAVRDRLVDERGRVLTVTGTRGSSGGAGRSYLVDCEYSPDPGGE